MEFWSKITDGYNLFKKGDYDRVIQESTELENRSLSIDEDLALASLIAWASLFTRNHDSLGDITTKLSENKVGTMPAWYRGLGFFLKGLMGIYSSSDNRFVYFQEAANNYETHINQEIMEISSPPNRVINTTVSTYFQAISILEATGKLEKLIHLEKKVTLSKNGIEEQPISEIINAINLQIKVHQNFIQFGSHKDITEFEGYEIDPIYYCNLIMRFED